jgi:hypothetical protein
LNSLSAQAAEKQASLQSAAIQAENEIAFEEADAHTLEHEQVQQAGTRATELAQQEQQLNEQLESLRASEREQMTRIDELKSRVREQEETLRHVLNEAQRQANDEESRIAELQQARAQTEAQARERAALADSLTHEIRTFEPAESDGVLELLDEPQTKEIKGIEPVIEQGSLESYNQVKEIAPAEVPWLQIDLDHSKNGNGSSATPELIQVPAQSNALEAWSNAAAGLEPADDSTVSAHILQTLKSEASTDRAAALTDLAQIGGEEAFELITQLFDDPAIEVRNAAARALYDLSTDRAGSFTRALREATAERRRKIGAAIAGSGLAVDAINSLSGEGRERTYDAYSLLFLMAKSGEVSPLMQAISRHSNLDVRLTSIKLLAMSNQQQVLSSLRHLAAREALPPEVQSAVMEAIYSISTQAREHAPSLA